jgi:[acyl-carrier-protein] S-malonyltransferase
MNQTSPSLSRDAVVFPGQGAQRPGMARDFCAAFGLARDVFAEASDALDLDVSVLCSGEDGRLELTEYAQPAILTAEIAMFRVICSEYGLRSEIFGGHSLGEYSALCAAGVIPLRDAVRIVRRRGAAMQRAAPLGEGGMVAVNRASVEHDVIAAVAADFDVDIASFNSPDQVVLSGMKVALTGACADLATRGYELVHLDVSAPFHSRFMAGAAPDLLGVLDLAMPHFNPVHAARVVSNVDGIFHISDGRALVEALVRQLSSPVHWRRNMSLLGDCADRIFEIGPSRPLRGLFRSVGLRVSSITSLVGAEREFRA